MPFMSCIAVIDFETTGGSPALGDRATEVAIVILEDGLPVERFQSLMNAGRRIPGFISQLTGITNAMIADAPPAAEVMREAARFVGELPMAAHNAAFDRRFWQAELALAGLEAPHDFICTVMLSRRLYPDAPSHRLGELADYHGLPTTGQAHRALADAEMAAHLLGRMQADLRGTDGRGRCDPDWLMRVQSLPKPRVAQLMATGR
ncbi:MAG: polymerase subunit epsilon [Pseudomonadota bacterium]|nr:polymerase subunit epsilon [Pseudomonadota bacterium]